MFQQLRATVIEYLEGRGIGAVLTSGRTSNSDEALGPLPPAQPTAVQRDGVVDEDDEHSREMQLLLAQPTVIRVDSGVGKVGRWGCEQGSAYKGWRDNKWWTIVCGRLGNGMHVA